MIPKKTVMQGRILVCEHHLNPKLLETWVVPSLITYESVNKYHLRCRSAIEHMTEDQIAMTLRDIGINTKEKIEPIDVDVITNSIAGRQHIYVLNQLHQDVKCIRLEYFTIAKKASRLILKSTKSASGSAIESLLTNPSGPDCTAAYGLDILLHSVSMKDEPPSIQTLIEPEGDIDYSVKSIQRMLEQSELVIEYMRAHGLIERTPDLSREYLAQRIAAGK